jgi:hypothetical protein
VLPSSGADVLRPMRICVLRQDYPSKGKGRQLADFRYYRCSGTDGYRFGGECICTNTQISGESLETAIWEYVRKIVKNPGILDQEDVNSEDCWRWL